eukprot:gene22236-25195_t
MLVPKGSSQSETALKYCCDLDIDIILPRAQLQLYTSVTPADWSQEITSLLLRYIAFQLNMNDNTAVQLRMAKDAKSNNLTRSIPLVVTIDCIDVEVDIFFKFFDQDGTIIGLSKKDSNGNRHFTAESLFQRHVLSRQMTAQEMDERKATILLFKKLLKQVKGYLKQK